jgi:hypothetical protein
MPAIIAIVALIFIVILAVAILGFAAHLLFSPWLWVAALAVLAWAMLRSRHSRR